MQLDTTLELTETCDLCARRVRRVYPLTRYDGQHWRPVRACLSCCGPGGGDDVARSVRIDFRAPKRRTL